MSKDIIYNVIFSNIESEEQSNNNVADYDLINEVASLFADFMLSLPNDN